MTVADAFERYRDVLQSLTADNLHLLDDVVTPDVRFSDPFHTVTGADSMTSVFARLFETADDIVFVIDDWVCGSQAVYFRWTMTATLSDRPWSVTGVTRATFDEAGRVIDHVEYWDAASQLYERFPVIGPLLRYVRRRIADR
jgi:hypothetical protein